MLAQTISAQTISAQTILARGNIDVNTWMSVA
jgi:hypothetical protein